MYLTKITKHGQITLPAFVRGWLEVGAGDRVAFVVNDRGEFVISPAPDGGVPMAVKGLAALQARERRGKVLDDEFDRLVRDSMAAARRASENRNMHSRTLLLERDYDVDPSIVRAAWTTPEGLARWYPNPARPVPPVPEVDLLVGGFWRVYMDIDDDTAYFTGGRYLRIEDGHDFEFAWGATDGWPAIAGDPAEGETVVTVELTAEPTGTRMIVVVELGSSIPDEWVPACRAGWTDTVERLGPSLAA